MKIAERIILVTLLLVLFAGGAWIYFAVQQDHQEKLDAVARGEFEIRNPETVYTEDNWQALYPGTVPARIGSTTVQASVADSLPERIQGLSETPFLPENVVKLFVFGTAGSHSIWMKDMQYPLDILWLDEAGLVVHIEENIAPETFPDSFASPVPAWYVIEANAGFVAQHNITLGDDFVVLAE
jgi:uncharacterized membrane protein (UPF0127 family)